MYKKKPRERERGKEKENFNEAICTHLVDCNTIYFSSSPLYRLPLPFFFLSLSLSLFSFSYRIVSFLFDDTNIDSIGDNKSYHFLMNACIRSKFFDYAEFNQRKSLWIIENLRRRKKKDSFLLQCLIEWHMNIFVIS